MSAWGSSLHDAEIVAVESHREPRALSLRLRMHDSASAVMWFTDVVGWELSPFREQNVLFDVHAWSASDVGTKERCEEFELPQVWAEAILHGASNLYELDASVGLGGYVVAGNAEVR
ncbi:hypothetical protein [Archangium sp.]|uniref:hypothetical protein n=1 Tax=Archangium sp. TaxID=1872627 RepID=UPI00286C6130|nr:hypothetical protein [Archangium sp.]